MPAIPIASMGLLAITISQAGPETLFWAGLGYLYDRLQMSGGPPVRVDRFRAAAAH